jgi:hypothetical protein
VFTVVHDLDSDVIVEELVVILEDLVCLLKILDKFNGAYFGKLTQRINS